MEPPERPWVVALTCGAISAIFFEVAFVGWIFKNPDPQAGIALVLSPIYAAWIGGSVGLIVLGSRLLIVAKKNAHPRGGAVAILIFGLVAFALIAGFLISEFYEATHPENVAAYFVP